MSGGGVLRRRNLSRSGVGGVGRARVLWGREKREGWGLLGAWAIEDRL